MQSSYFPATPGTPTYNRAQSYSQPQPQRAALDAELKGKGKDTEGGAGDDDGDKDEEGDKPLMQDDDYAIRMKLHEAKKENQSALLEHFSEEQRTRHGLFREGALNKGTVRKLVQQSLNATCSDKVAQIIAGFGKVFVGEMTEKAREVQASRGESGPLAPEHLREAYRLYVDERGRMGAARPHRGRRLFAR